MLPEVFSTAFVALLEWILSLENLQSDQNIISFQQQINMHTG